MMTQSKKKFYVVWHEAGQKKAREIWAASIKDAERQINSTFNPRACLYQDRWKEKGI